MSNELAGLFFDIASADDLKRKFIEHMDFLKSLSVQEMTLYKTWSGIHYGEYRRYVDRSQVVKAKIWKPSDIKDKILTLDEFDKLQPRIRYVKTSNERDANDWVMLRTFCSSAAFDQNPGRFLRFLIDDKVTGKFLGLASIASDVMSVSARDKWIGWTKESKLEKGKLRCTAIGTTIVATQPFGYNFLGGKLIASILLDPLVREIWKQTYGDVLVGMTTTSLYGTESMYNSIPFWKKLGATVGSIYLKPDDIFYNEWHQWLKENKREEYDKNTTPKEGVVGPITGVKQKILDMIFKEVGISASTYMHGFSRGVYFAPLYNNTREFLRSEIEEDKLEINDRLKNGLIDILAWWKPKARARYEKLYEEGRTPADTLFYNDMIDLQWNEAKKKYLGEVGR